MAMEKTACDSYAEEGRGHIEHMGGSGVGGEWGMGSWGQNLYWQKH